MHAVSGCYCVRTLACDMKAGLGWAGLGWSLGLLLFCEPLSQLTRTRHTRRHARVKGKGQAVSDMYAMFGVGNIILSIGSFELRVPFPCEKCILLVAVLIVIVHLFS